MLIELINEDKFKAIHLSHEIKQIASPLHLLNITYFNHIRVFKDLSRISLATHPDWLMHFFSEKYYRLGRFSKDPLKFSDDFSSLWKIMPDDTVINDASQNFNIDNGITIIKSYSEYKDFYLFASTRDNFKINEFYLSNFDLLERFIAYYQEKGSRLIKECKPDKAIFTKEEVDQEKHTEAFLDNKSINKFIELTQVTKWPVYYKKQKFEISNKEYLCFKLLLQGKTPKQISQILDIKTPTYYRHMENVRNKLGICSTAKLIELFNKKLL